jgi:hypothetical protein
MHLLRAYQNVSRCSVNVLDTHMFGSMMQNATGGTFLRTFLTDSASQSLQHVTYVDQCPEMVNLVRTRVLQHVSQTGRHVTFTGAVADEEFLPFPSASHDCTIFILSAKCSCCLLGVFVAQAVTASRESSVVRTPEHVLHGLHGHASLCTRWALVPSNIWPTCDECGHASCAPTRAVDVSAMHH